MGSERGRVSNPIKPPGRGEVRDVAPGLWIWQTTHPHWMAGQGWDPVVSSTFVESKSQRLILDPIVPPAGSQAWKRLERTPPTAVVVLKPDHVRDVDLFAERSGIPALGPDRFLRDEVPETRPEPIFPGSSLPGGLVALHDGRGRNETPVWLPLQRTIVFADGLTAPQGELRVWGTPWHEERTLPALRELLRLPFERVVVSHGEPVHSRLEYERALEREPWEPRSKKTVT